MHCDDDILCTTVVCMCLDNLGDRVKKRFNQGGRLLLAENINDGEEV